MVVAVLEVELLRLLVTLVEPVALELAAAVGGQTVVLEE